MIETRINPLAEQEQRNKEPFYFQWLSDDEKSFINQGVERREALATHILESFVETFPDSINSLDALTKAGSLESLKQLNSTVTEAFFTTAIDTFFTNLFAFADEAEKAA